MITGDLFFITVVLVKLINQVPRLSAAQHGFYNILIMHLSLCSIELIGKILILYTLKI